MTTRKTVVLFLAIGVSAAAPAMAGDFLYPWKPGVSLRQVSDDQVACQATAKVRERKVNEAERRLGPGQPAPSGSKAWIAPGLDGMGAFYNGYYDCLRDGGYSIRRMSANEYKLLKKQGGPAIMATMTAPTSPHAEVPRGIIK